MMNISRSTASLDDFTALSSVDKLSRLSKAYSLTDLSKRKRSGSAESRTFDKDTTSSRNKVKLNKRKSTDNLKERTLSRITKNIERDRNSEQKLSQQYRERWKGVMNQTTSRTESKKRDSAVLSSSAGRTRLPPISQPKQQTMSGPRARSGPQARSGRYEQDARVRSGIPEQDTRVRSVPEDTATRARSGAKSGRYEDQSSRGRSGKYFVGAVNRAVPGKSLASTVKRAAASNRPGKPVDDVQLNKKYSECVCETCKLQIHEKLKRGYTKYKSLEKMKACNGCQKMVIDFDFYQICVDCAKALNVCAKCATGSCKMSGARFVEVVRSGVEENLLEMDENELKRFAKKHAKIGITEQKISQLEQSSTSETTSATTTRSSSARSSSARSSSARSSSARSSSARSSSVRSSSARSKRGSKQSTKQINAKLKVEAPLKVSTSKSKKVIKKARSMTSSSSPLAGGGSETETYISSAESDEAYGSGHISSVEIKTVVSSAGKNKRTRKKSSEILRQIRSLTNLEVTSPTLAQSVIREIRSLTEINIDEEEDEDSQEEERRTPDKRKTPEKRKNANKRKTPEALSPIPCYTPFSEKSIVDDGDIEPYMTSRTPTKERLPPITSGTNPVITNQASHSDNQLEPEESQDLREYSPSPPVITIKSVPKVPSEDVSDTEDESDVEDGGKTGEEDDGAEEVEDIVEEVNEETDTAEAKDKDSAGQASETCNNKDISVKETLEDATETNAVVQDISKDASKDDALVKEVSIKENAEVEEISKDTGEVDAVDEGDTKDANEDVAEVEEISNDSGKDDSVIEEISKNAVEEEALGKDITKDANQDVAEVEYISKDAVEDDAVVKETLEDAGKDDAVIENIVNDSRLTELALGTKVEGVDNAELVKADNAKKESIASTEENRERVITEDKDETKDLATSDECSAKNAITDGVHAGNVVENSQMTVDDVSAEKDVAATQQDIDSPDGENYVVSHKNIDHTVAALPSGKEETNVEISKSNPKTAVAEKYLAVDVDGNDQIEHQDNTTELEHPQEESQDYTLVMMETVSDSELEISTEDTAPNNTPEQDNSGEYQPHPSSTETEFSTESPRLNSSAFDKKQDEVFNVAHRSGKFGYERQVSESTENAETRSVLDTIGRSFEEFSEFHRNNAFDIVEIHKTNEGVLYGEDEEDDYYERCYEYQYNARMRIRLEDIPEEGTLSKETTYIGSVFTDTMEKEDTVLEKEDSLLTSSLEREATIEDTARDIVTNALLDASISPADNEPRVVVDS